MLTGPAVVGLDLSLKATGLANTRGDTFVIDGRPAKGYARIHVITTRIVARIRASRPDLVVLEGYAPNSIGINSTIKSAELGGYVRTVLTVAGYRWIEVPPNTLKLWATGNGRASKDEMVDEALKRGAPNAEITHDEADAWLARAWGLAHLKGNPL